ncbi:MAG: hypothetical protein ACPLKP_01365 [Microgenomates group bacterium]
MLKNNKFFILILIIWTLWVTHWAWVLPYNMAPDECLHFKTAKFFQEEKRLPVAGKEKITVIREKDCQGTTYIETPFLNYIITAIFINFKGLVKIERDYLAGRMSSVFFGIIFVVLYYLFLKKFFLKNTFIVYSTLVSTIFIPQVTYIFAYINQEAYSLASSVFLILISLIFYQLSKEKIKEKKYWVLLGLSLALHFFSKTNFWLLFLIPLLFLGVRFWQVRKLYFQNLLIISLIPLFLSGWFFMRNWLIYKDFLGIKTYQEITKANFVSRTFNQAGWTVYDVLFKSKWIEETLSSFYGRFGYMTIEIDPVMQWIFRGFLFLGLVGLIEKLTEKKKIIIWEGNNLFYLLFTILIPLNIAFSLWNSLYFDFQNQGRYLFPVLIPIMVLANMGIFNLVKDKNIQKNLTIAIITGSIILNLWSFLYLPKF